MQERARGNVRRRKEMSQAFIFDIVQMIDVDCQFKNSNCSIKNKGFYYLECLINETLAHIQCMLTLPV